MVRQLPDGSWEFDTVDEAVQFMNLRADEVVPSAPVADPSSHGNGFSSRATRRSHYNRLKPTEFAKVVDSATLLDRVGLKLKDAHNFIYQRMLTALQVGDDPWLTNKQLVELAKDDPDYKGITSVDVSYGLTYLLIQNLIEEHPDDKTVTRGNRYRIREEVLDQ